ncbi:O-antigen ligase family protein [Vibrio brasiliensis]
MKYIDLKIWERFLLLSPVIWSWAIVFNFPESKHVISRLVALVCLYCVTVYPSEVRSKIRHKESGFFLLLLALIASYFSFLHYFRGGHFDFARVVWTIFFYFLLVPYRFFEHKILREMIFVSSLFFGAVACYQLIILNDMRIGGVVNSGPYGFAAGLLLVLVLVDLFNYKKVIVRNIAFDVISFVILVLCIALSQTRTSWLAMFVVLFFVMIRCLRNKSFKMQFALIGVFLIGSVTLTHVDMFKKRVNATKWEYSQIEKGNLNTSLGSRYDMWFNGLEFIKSSPIIGLSDKEEQSKIQTSYQIGTMQDRAHKILHHNKSSYHNIFVQAGVKGGVIALALMCLLLLTPFLIKCDSHYKVYSYPIAIFTVISTQFESHFTIYNQAAYFYIFLIGCLIMSSLREGNGT